MLSIIIFQFFALFTHGALKPCVTLEGIPVGTQYGQAVGQTPGNLAFTQNNVKVFVQKFEYVNGGGTFNSAKIEVPPRGFSWGNSIRSNNINLVFDFSAGGIKVRKVSFKFLDLGGFENFSVNGSPLYKGELTSLPAFVNGVRVQVSKTLIKGGKKGSVELTGKITRFTIGGQELWLDSICGF